MVPPIMQMLFIIPYPCAHYTFIVGVTVSDPILLLSLPIEVPEKQQAFDHFLFK